MSSGPHSTGSSSSGGSPPRTIQFNCVKCGQAIRVGHPSSPARVECPKCELPFAILPDGQIARQDNANAFEDLPPAMVVNVAPPRAKGFRNDPIPASPVAEVPEPGGRIYRPIDPPTHRRSDSQAQTVKRIIGASIAICFACLIGGGIWYLTRQFDPDDVITRLMASMEKPEELWREVIANGTGATAALSELVADQTLDRQALETRVTSDWDRSRSKLKNLRKRATYLEPMTRHQLDAYLRQIDPVMQALSESPDTSADYFSFSSETRESWFLYEQEFKKTIRRVATLSAPIPSGADLKSQVARQAAQIERKLYIQAARQEPDYSQDSVADRTSLEDSVATAVMKYQDLADKLERRLAAAPIVEDQELFDMIRRLNYRNLYPTSTDGSSQIEQALSDLRIEVLGADLIAQAEWR